MLTCIHSLNAAAVQLKDSGILGAAEKIALDGSCRPAMLDYAQLLVYCML